MPIKIDNQLPAHHSLELENIFVMTEDRAVKQDIRPLKNYNTEFNAYKNRDRNSAFKASQ